MNLLCGVLGVIFTMEGRISLAFPLMLAAAAFDFCDGLAARALHVTSEIGKELDSLSDMVSFGVLPALMLYKSMGFALIPGILRFFPVLIAIAAGLRLAKFNVDERQHTSFLGLATPASAMVCGSLAYYVASRPASWMALATDSLWFIPAVSVLLAALMVSEIPMFSMKGGSDWLASIKRIAFISVTAIIVIVVAVMGQNWSLAVLMTFIAYILMNLIFSLSKHTR